MRKPMHPSSETKRFTIYGLFIWLIAVTFFFYEFFLRVLPATVAKSIISSLDISVEQFAIIASCYYLTYSLMQIPVGFLLDRYRARLLISIAAAMCSLGVLWFSFAQGFIPAFIGRLMIGFGSSFGFVSLMIVTLNWFPKKYFAFLIGCGQFLGAIGPLCAGGPIALMLKAVNGDWRLIFFWVGIFGLILTALIAIFLRGRPIVKVPIIFIDREKSLKTRLKLLLNRPQVWWILIYAGTVYVALPLLGAFWGTSYLETRGFDKPAAAFLISMIWIGLAVGSPTFGRLSDLIRRRKPLICICALVGILSSLAVLWTPIKNELFLGGMFFLIGFAGSGQNLSFALIAENTPKSLKGTALGLNNTFIMGFAAVIPPLVTKAMQNFAEGGTFTAAIFEKGFMVMPVAFGVAFLVALLGINETFCRQQQQVHRL